MRVGDVVECTKKCLFPPEKAPNTTGVIVFASCDRKAYYLVKFDGWVHGHNGNHYNGVHTFKGNNCWWLYDSSLTLVDEFDGNV